MSEATKPHDLDDLVKEIVKNARADRKRLETVCDSVISAAQESEDPMAVLGLSEQMAMITDSLTKNNSQLVEIAKIRAKERMPKDEKHDESIFSEIENVVQA